jgi:regulatory protein SWI6
MMYYQAQNPAWSSSLKRVRQEDGEFEPSSPGLAPPVDINGHRQMVETPIYVDSYGQPYHVTSPQLDMSAAYMMAPPPAKRVKQVGAVPATPVVAEPLNNGDGVAEGSEDEDDADESGSEPALPASMRLANKPHRPRAAAKDGNRTRTRLLSIFQKEDPLDLTSLLGLDEPAADGDANNSSPVQGPSSGFELDLVIDEQGHTALHWACALARTSVIAQLIEAGADIHRGNYAGETPLIRSVLTTNHADGDTFATLLAEHLAPSIRTLDLAYRSVLHHIALIAGVKGRAASARHYMAAVLEHVAKEQQTAKGALDGSQETESTPLSLKALIDVQDVHGDTALNVAARVGNKGLVNMLLDAGADKTKGNKLGLRPVDFGVEVEVSRLRSCVDLWALLTRCRHCP